MTVFSQWSDGKKVYFNPVGVLVERDLASEAERDVYSVNREVFGALSPDGQYIAVAHESVLEHGQSSAGTDRRRSAS